MFLNVKFPKSPEIGAFFVGCSKRSKGVPKKNVILGGCSKGVPNYPENTYKS